uniref:Arrestin domain containing 2 n=1 Tax=Cyprinus carpio carpio TaxID=630221 RepID=A0A8C1CVR0_CYPCA
MTSGQSTMKHLCLNPTARHPWKSHLYNTSAMCRFELKNIHITLKRVMAFQSIKRFALELDGPEDTVYGSGEMISGVVILELNRDITVRALRVLGRGVAAAHWLENRNVGVSTVYSDHTSKITYFRKRRHLIRDNGELTVLSAGRHEYPFSFQLPEETLVTSFEGKHGSIRYWVKVKLHRPWATVKKIKKEFTVIEPIDINTPSLLAPQAGTKEKMARIWYRNCGQVSITAKIDRKGYTPGEVIPVFAEFDNSTSRSVVPKAYITQTQTFLARGTMKQKRAVVATLSGDILGARRRETWHGRAIKIPPVGPSILQCRIIKVEYTLRVCVNVPGTSKLSLELPLVMGTIPLHPFGSRTSSVSSQYSVNMEWLRMAIPEQPEPPPDYSSVVSDEDAVQSSTAVQPEEDLSGVLQRSLLAYVQEFRLRPPPVYSEVDPNPQPITMRPRCMTY